MFALNRNCVAELDLWVFSNAVIRYLKICCFMHEGSEILAQLAKVVIYELNCMLGVYLVNLFDIDGAKCELFGEGSRS